MVVLKRSKQRRSCLCCKGKSGPFSLHQGLGFGEEAEEDDYDEPAGKKEKPAPQPTPPNESRKEAAQLWSSSRLGWASTATLVLVAAAAAYKLHRVWKK